VRSQLTAASLIQYAEEVYGPYIWLANGRVPGSYDCQDETVITFDREQKALYKIYIGQQRTEAKRIVTKRKANTVGKAKQACR